MRYVAIIILTAWALLQTFRVPAHAVHTLNSVIYWPETGEIAVIVIPDNDDEISPNVQPGQLQANIPAELFNTLTLEGLRYWLGVYEFDQGLVAELPAWAYVPPPPLPPAASEEVAP